ncbi:MAG: hypothetical protein K2N81_05925 [Acetatifactor sp.]|nr:hypothetical protein [Acetatifactor sp.]
MDNFREFKKANYGKKVCAFVEGGVVYFDPDSLKEVVGAGNMMYDEYLDTQIRSLGKYRSGFEACYFNFPMGFKGQIEKMTKNTVCFKRVFIEGMYADGTMFDGKEEHVWMSKSGFESFQVGDCVEFFAEIYRYVKTGNGKLIDYSLRNPEGIKKIANYKLPSDDDLVKQEVKQIICETCFLSEQCNKVFCMRSLKNRRA